MVNGAEQAIIASTWNAFTGKLGGSNDTTGEAFYIKLFATYPDVQLLFPKFKNKSADELKGTAPLLEQSGKVVKKICDMVAAFGNDAKTAEFLAEHRKYHRKIKIGGEHMAKAGAVLCGLMKATLGDEFNGAAEKAWVAFMDDLKNAIDKD